MAFEFPTDARSKKLMAGAVVVIAVVGAYWWFMWKPEQVIVKATAAHADTLDALNAKAKLEVENGMEAKLRADADRISRELLVLRRLVPTENELPGLINSISTAARQAGMEISELTPDGELPGDQFNAHRYKLAVTGPYHRVAEFFASIGSLPRIVTPINVEVFSSSRAIERRPGKNETFVDVKFGVLTYVAKAVVAPPPAPPAKPGGN